MKKRSLIFFILLTFAVRIFSQQDRTNIETASPLNISLENLDSGKVYQSKLYYRNLRIKITNITDSAFSFFTMTCSWEGIFRFDPAIAYRIYLGCDSNTPNKIKLKPKESFTLEGKYKFSDITFKNVVLISVGLRVITHFSKWVSYPFEIFYGDPNYTYKDFIWSKPISISF